MKIKLMPIIQISYEAVDPSTTSAFKALCDKLVLEPIDRNMISILKEGQNQGISFQIYEPSFTLILREIDGFKLRP